MIIAILDINTSGKVYVRPKLFWSTSVSPDLNSDECPKKRGTVVPRNLFHC